MSAGSGLIRALAMPGPHVFVTLDGVPQGRVHAFDADAGWVELNQTYVGGVSGLYTRKQRLHGRVAAYHHRPRWWPA